MTFFAALLTGMPIWTPVFGWMAPLFGGLHVCRVLHPWFGIAFALAIRRRCSSTGGRHGFEPEERGWLGPKALQYLRYQSDDTDVGKYNGGQKLYFFTSRSARSDSSLRHGHVVPAVVPRRSSASSHSSCTTSRSSSFAVSLVLHIYLATAAEPGTFGSMTRGTVTRQWARLHHPRWLREVTGEEDRRR